MIVKIIEKRPKDDEQSFQVSTGVQKNGELSPNRRGGCMEKTCLRGRVDILRLPRLANSCIHNRRKNDDLDT